MYVFDRIEYFYSRPYAAGGGGGGEFAPPPPPEIFKAKKKKKHSDFRFSNSCIC